MHIILHQPEIPANTGNIGRTCVATGTSLHLIEPLGFRLNEKEIKRAGMDYWQHLDVNRYTNFAEFHEKHPGAKIWMATTKAKHVYTDVRFGMHDYIMFGKESAGIPEEILVEHEENCIRVPMLPAIRSLNLSNSVAIVLYEALRQNGFSQMQLEGELHQLHWKQDHNPPGMNGTKAPVPSSVYIAPGAIVLGDVTLGENASIWYHAVIRGDRASIRIGGGSNIQDNSVIHVDADYPVAVGENVTVGHGAILHGCTIGDNTLIGMGAILMNGSHIGRNCIIGAGALVTQNMEIPNNSLVVGNPAKVKRPVTPEEVQGNLRNAHFYAAEAQLEKQNQNRDSTALSGLPS